MKKAFYLKAGRMAAVSERKAAEAQMVRWRQQVVDAVRLDNANCVALLRRLNFHINANADGECWPSMRTLCDGLGMEFTKRRSVQRWLRQLKKMGFVSVVRQNRDDGGDTSNRYRVEFAVIAEHFGVDFELSQGGDRVSQGGDRVSRGGDRVSHRENQKKTKLKPRESNTGVSQKREGAGLPQELHALIGPKLFTDKATFRQFIETAQRVGFITSDVERRQLAGCVAYVSRQRKIDNKCAFLVALLTESVETAFETPWRHRATDEDMKLADRALKDEQQPVVSVPLVGGFERGESSGRSVDEQRRQLLAMTKAS